MRYGACYMRRYFLDLDFWDILQRYSRYYPEVTIIDNARPPLKMRDPRLCPDPSVSCLSYQTNLPTQHVLLSLPRVATSLTVVLHTPLPYSRPAPSIRSHESPLGFTTLKVKAPIHRANTGAYLPRNALLLDLRYLPYWSSGLFVARFGRTLLAVLGSFGDS